MIRREKIIDEIFRIMESEEFPSFIQLTVCSKHIAEYEGKDKTAYVEKYQKLYQKVFG